MAPPTAAATTSLGMAAAYEGVTREPGAGRLLSGALVRAVIQPVPALLGRVKGPVNVAPAWRVMTSPGCAALSAACTSPPAETGRVVPVGATSVVSRKTRASSGGNAADRATIGVGRSG